jgi:ribonucleoside-diphosphate reductase alpha chain
MDCDTTGIEPDYSLVKYKKLAGGGTMKIVNGSVGCALDVLGYSKLQKEAILKHVDECGAIEGAPHLKEEHLQIFDCSSRCGEGTRYIAPMGHLKMVAAVQPFLSGSVSKTVNVPNETTWEEMRELYTTAWKLGIKGVALYRDGSKASQPLQSAKPKVIDTAPCPTIPCVRPQGQRVRLPKKRNGFTQEGTVGGHKIYLRTGNYEDGTLGEIFIDLAKEGSTLRSLFDGLAVSVSIGLQYGVPLEAYVYQFCGTRFEPAGVVTGHPNIKLASSMNDYIFRVLAVEYLKRYDLANVKPDEVEETTEPMPPSGVNAKTGGMICPSCGGMMVTSGACHTCNQCGTTSGCG